MTVRERERDVNSGRMRDEGRGWKTVADTLVAPLN